MDDFLCEIMDGIHFSACLILLGDENIGDGAFIVV